MRKVRWPLWRGYLTGMAHYLMVTTKRTVVACGGALTKRGQLAGGWKGKVAPTRLLNRTALWSGGDSTAENLALSDSLPEGVRLGIFCRNIQDHRCTFQNLYAPGVDSKWSVNISARGPTERRSHPSITGQSAFGYKEQTHSKLANAHEIPEPSFHSKGEFGPSALAGKQSAMPLKHYRAVLKSEQMIRLQEDLGEAAAFNQHLDVSTRAHALYSNTASSITDGIASEGIHGPLHSPDMLRDKIHGSRIKLRRRLAMCGSRYMYNMLGLPPSQNRQISMASTLPLLPQL